MGESEDTYESRRGKLYKVTKTIFLVLVWVCLGLHLEITGPTLIDLKIQTHENYENIAFAISGRSLGYFLGSALGGVLVDRFGLFCELMVAVCLDGGAVATAVIPLVSSYWAIWAFCICQGTFEGVINIAGQKLILMMWLGKSASPLHLLHSGFGVGSFIIPLIANPFLAVPVPDNDGNQTSFSNSTTSYSTTTQTQYLKESNILYAYIIAAAITASLSVVFYTYHVTGSRARTEQRVLSKSSKTTTKAIPFREMFNPATCAGGRLVYGIQIFGLVFVYFFVAVGCERIGGKFIRAYSIDQLGFTTDDGTYINTIFWISYAIGRFSGFIAARWIPIRILIVIETGGLLVSAVLLMIFGGNTTGFWVIMQPMGFFTAPLFPSGIGWTNIHIAMTGVGITTLLLGGSLGGIAAMKLIGFLYDHYGPKTYQYTLLGYGIAAFVLSVLMDIAGAQHGDRFAKEKETVEPENRIEGIDGPYKD